MNAFGSYIGVDLGGGKGKNTAVARLRALEPSEGGDGARVEVVDYGIGKDTPWYDDQLLAYLAEHKDALVAIDAPLSLPACVRCQLDVCPGHQVCDVPIVRWFRERAQAQAAMKKPRYTPYTQRATEVLLAEREASILPREALGQGMGPLTARAAYLLRALRGHGFVLGENLIEVYPKATLTRLFGQKQTARYKRSAGESDARLAMLNGLPELRFAPGAWREHALSNDHKFDAVICAYTAYLYTRGLCVPPPADDAVSADGWIWAPAEAPGVRS